MHSERRHYNLTNRPADSDGAFALGYINTNYGLSGRFLWQAMLVAIHRHKRLLVAGPQSPLIAQQIVRLRVLRTLPEHGHF